ncbi:tyrosine-type recombinase/integrase [Bacillus sp. UNC438CL73TsuS30]|uniref:tyrosine-type recombinase/integrase n=1 Tax=Bacillus sp. UNC438CL73TsuS30 TaxID=1340434 RepID=UPI00047CEEE3|nr:tyrosine-type recombinase/integrase [Bacillus sp. UNC438CL73TsuS30]
MSEKRKGKTVKSARSRSRDLRNLDDLFEKFKRIKQAEGRAAGTMIQYSANYGYFIGYLDDYGIPRSMDAISREVIRDYIVYMKDQKIKFEDHRCKTEQDQTIGLAPSTINTRLKTLRVYFKTLMDEGLIDENPMDGIKNINEPEEEIVVLNADELRRLLNVPNQRNYADFRDYVMMNLLLDGMLRISEALGLRIQDFDFQAQTVTIPGEIAKNRKARTLPLQKRTMRLIQELIEENAADFDRDHIFLSNYGELLTRDHFRNRLNKFAVAAKIRKNVHPHLFRHTSATMFLEAGGDIRHLQLLLGHSDLRMVTRYTHLSRESLKRQHDQYSAINNVLDKLNKSRKIKR